MKNRQMITVTAFLFLGLSGAAWAASTGNLTLSGSVTAVNSIAITPNGSNNTSLNILSGEAGKNVAAVDETSNNPLGFKIFMYSTNGGQLRHTVDPSKKTTYTISYDGGSYAAPPTSSSPAQVKNVSSLTGLTVDTSQVLINVASYATAIAGTYTDTLTLSIVAN